MIIIKGRDVEGGRFSASLQYRVVITTVAAPEE